MQLISQPEPAQGKSPGKTTQPKKRKTGYVLIPALLILAAIFIAYLQQPSTNKITEPPVPAVETKKEATPATESVPQRTMSGHLLQINAHDTTWLQVMIDKADLKELLMQPGDAVEWHAEECFSLKIGNAGGIKLRFDGKELTNLGEAGQVVTINLPESGT